MTTWLCISVFQLCFLTISTINDSYLSCNNVHEQYISKVQAVAVLKAFQDHKQYECSLIDSNQEEKPHNNWKQD